MVHDYRMLLKYVSIQFIRLEILLFYFTDDYIIYWGMWLSDAAIKFKTMICQYPPPVEDTYFTSMYTYTLNWLLLMISYYWSFII